MMAARRTSKTGADTTDADIPAWQRQSMDRSLRAARARAHERSDRFVAAATELLRDRGTVDFTVQDVVEHSGMSIRTFYKYFASKEDLLLAVSETVVAREAVPRLEKLVAKHKDPLKRLRAFVEGLLELSTGTTKSVARTLASYQNRLAESRPDDLAQAMKPQFDLFLTLVEDVARTHPLRDGLTVEHAARLTHNLVLTAVHGRLFGAEGSSEVSTDTIWEFCAAGMGIGAGTTQARRTKRSPSTKPAARRSA